MSQQLVNEENNKLKQYIKDYNIADIISVLIHRKKLFISTFLLIFALGTVLALTILKPVNYQYFRYITVTNPRDNSQDAARLVTLLNKKYIPILVETLSSTSNINYIHYNIRAFAINQNQQIKLVGDAKKNQGKYIDTLFNSIIEKLQEEEAIKVTAEKEILTNKLRLFEKQYQSLENLSDMSKFFVSSKTLNSVYSNIISTTSGTPSRDHSALNNSYKQLTGFTYLITMPKTLYLTMQLQFKLVTQISSLKDILNNLKLSEFSSPLVRSYKPVGLKTSQSLIIIFFLAGLLALLAVWIFPTEQAC